MSVQRGWIGVDLDGTLARYDGWKGIDHIGEPVPAILAYVKELFVEGVEVRILTARCQEGLMAIMHIENWCLKHLGYILPVTDKKDFGMVFMIDDRAYRVKENEGTPVIGVSGVLPSPIDVAKSINWHWSPENPKSPSYVGNQ